MTAPEYPAVQIEPPGSGGSKPEGSGGKASRRGTLAQLWGSRAGRFALAAGVALVILIVTLARRSEPEAPKTPETPATDPLLADPFADLGSGLGATSVPDGGFDFGGQVISGENGGLVPVGGFNEDGQELAPVTQTPVTVIVQPATPQPVAPQPPNTGGAGTTPGPGKPVEPVKRKRGFYRAGLGVVTFEDGKGGAPVPVALTEADRKAINSTWASVKKTKKDQRFSLRGHSLTMNEQGSFAPV